MFLQKLNVLFTCFILCCGSMAAQNNALNQYDADGKRHGKWQKTYAGSDQIRYEGEFNHGKEVGTFKFYKPKSKDQPMATRTFFNDNDSVLVKFFTKTGKLVSKGMMLDKKREGTWEYYHKTGEQVMMTEPYKNDQLHGWKKVYFPNGKLTEKQEFKHGIADGEQFIYAKNGQLIQYYTFKNGKLNGLTKTFNADGDLLSKGYYKNGKRSGEWEFYNNGSVEKTETY